MYTYQGALEVRNSVTHQATVFANAVMHCGTTVDTFITENLEWLKRATNVSLNTSSSDAYLSRGLLYES